MRIQEAQESLLGVDLVIEAIPGMAPTEQHMICQPCMPTHSVG